MKKDQKDNRTGSSRVCSQCGKGPVSSFKRPHSLHKTKRKIYPNLQIVEGNLICTRCRKTRYKS